MKDETLSRLGTLLAVLRGYEMLDEVRPAAFHLDGRDFIHFHETPEGIVADVLLARGRVSMPVSSPSDQAELLDRIESRLMSVETNGDHRRNNRRDGGRRPHRGR